MCEGVLSPSLLSPLPPHVNSRSSNSIDADKNNKHKRLEMELVSIVCLMKEREGKRGKEREREGKRGKEKEGRGKNQKRREEIQIKENRWTDRVFPYFRFKIQK